MHNNLLLFPLVTFFFVKLKVFDFVRDSAGYIVDNHGNYLFSSVNFTDTLHVYIKYHPVNLDDFMYRTSFIMEKPDEKITVQAGSFDVLSFKATVKVNPGYTSKTEQMYNQYCYAENIGKVFESVGWLMGDGYVEQRLLRYHIKQREQ